MSDTFVIGDLHFGHTKVALLRGFANVNEHTEGLIERWNARVRKCDTVYVLGDVVFGAAHLMALDRLAGNKKLVMGNHDNEFSSSRWATHFGRVMGCAEVNGWLLTHLPVHPSQLERWPLNVHGHMHTNFIRADFDTVEHHGYFCASAERIGLAPISLSEIEQRKAEPIDPELLELMKLGERK